MESAPLWPNGAIANAPECDARPQERFSSPAASPSGDTLSAPEQRDGVIFHHGSRCWRAVFHDDEMVQDVSLGLRKSHRAATALYHCARYLRSWPENSSPQPASNILLEMPANEIESVVECLVNAKCLYPDDARERLNQLLLQKAEHYRPLCMGLCSDSLAAANAGLSHPRANGIAHPCQNGLTRCEPAHSLSSGKGGAVAINGMACAADAVGQNGHQLPVPDGSETESDAKTMSGSPETNNSAGCEGVRGVRLVTNGKRAGQYLVYVEHEEGTVVAVGYHSSVLKAAQLHDIVSIAQKGTAAQLNYPKHRYHLEEFIETLQKLPKLFSKSAFWCALKNGIDAGLRLKAARNGSSETSPEPQQPQPTGSRQRPSFHTLNRSFMGPRPPIFPGMIAQWPFPPRAMSNPVPRMWGVGSQFGVDAVPQRRDLVDEDPVTGSEAGCCQIGDPPSDPSDGSKTAADRHCNVAKQQSQDMEVPASRKSDEQEGDADACGIGNKGAAGLGSVPAEKNTQPGHQTNSEIKADAPVRYVAAPTRRPKSHVGELQALEECSSKIGGGNETGMLMEGHLTEEKGDLQASQVKNESGIVRNGYADGYGIGDVENKSQGDKHVVTLEPFACHLASVGAPPKHQAASVLNGQAPPVVEDGRSEAQRDEGLAGRPPTPAADGLAEHHKMKWNTDSVATSQGVEGRKEVSGVEQDLSEVTASDCQGAAVGNAASVTAREHSGCTALKDGVAKFDEANSCGSLHVVSATATCQAIGSTAPEQSPENIEPNHGSRHLGVTEAEGGERRSFVHRDGSPVEVGKFKLPEDASRAHDCAVLGLLGLGAQMDFPAGSYTQEQIKQALASMGKERSKDRGLAALHTTHGEGAACGAEELTVSELGREEELVEEFNVGTTRTGRMVRLPKRFREGTLEKDEVPDIDVRQQLPPPMSLPLPPPPPQPSKPKTKKIKRVVETAPKDHASFRGEDLLMHYGSQGKGGNTR
eukprot:evm.model.scf_982EXC.6 EVM.evm.TU.scf_982EXC.6   scf_982EXC:31188-34522(-)